MIFFIFCVATRVPIRRASDEFIPFSSILCVRRHRPDSRAVVSSVAFPRLLFVFVIIFRHFHYIRLCASIRLHLGELPARDDATQRRHIFFLFAVHCAHVTLTNNIIQ